MAAKMWKGIESIHVHLKVAYSSISSTIQSCRMSSITRQLLLLGQQTDYTYREIVHTRKNFVIKCEILS